jgi:hypothetical protein
MAGFCAAHQKHRVAWYSKELNPLYAALIRYSITLDSINQQRDRAPARNGTGTPHEIKT